MYRSSKRGGQPLVSIPDNRPQLIIASPESRPHHLIELIGRGIQYFAGTLPLAKALRGKVSRDPRVEEDFFADRECSPPLGLIVALCYHGWLRVATGFSLLAGMTELEKRAEEIDVRELRR